MILDKLGAFPSVYRLVQACSVLFHTDFEKLEHESIQCLHHGLPLGVREVQLIQVLLLDTADDDERLGYQVNQ